MRFSLKDYNPYDIGATSLFIASKTEETGRKLQFFIQASYKVAQKDNSKTIEPDSKEYWRWRDIILYNEELMLEALCFDLKIVPVYPLVHQICKKYHLTHTDIEKTAWKFANDR